MEEGSISFLKKRNKKLLLCWLTWLVSSMRNAAGKSFLVLFFKKELLSLLLPRNHFDERLEGASHGR
jgi:hypothetical protein